MRILYRLEHLKNKVLNLVGGGYLFYRRLRNHLWVKRNEGVLSALSRQFHQNIDLNNTRFLTVGFDDIRLSDTGWLAPLFKKYGYTATFNKILYGSESVYEKKILKKLILEGHEIGCHTLLHEQYPYFSPLCNGQDPNNPDGSGQQPFPSNDEIRQVEGNLSDNDCQKYRNQFSILKDEELGATLDILSHRYLGTDGRSDGSWSEDLKCYTRGIFTGCKTSENHEVWERIFKIQECLLAELRIGINSFKTWSWPGSKNVNVRFKKDESFYFDRERTKPWNNAARFYSSLKGKERSLTDVLREYGYVNTHDTLYPGRIDGLGEKEMRMQLFFNAYLSRKDALLCPTTRTIQHVHCRESEGLSKDYCFNECYTIDKKNANGIYVSFESLRHSLASGIVAGCVWDTIFSSKEQKYWENILRYCQMTGVSVLPKRNAYDVCFKQVREKGNLIYNAEFVNTLDVFIPDVDHPQNPDGWIGDSVLCFDEGYKTLLIKGEVLNKNYGVPYGLLKYSVDVKGKGEISIGFIRNNTNLSDDGEMVDKISSESSKWFKIEKIIKIDDTPLTDETDRYEGYGTKIIAISFKYHGNLQIRNLKLEKINS